MTPSGLIIGTTLKMKWSLSTTASALLDTRKSIKPFIIQLLFDSPGCTLADTNTPRFYAARSGRFSFDVIVKYSHLLPAIVLHNMFL
jgi:hypothetical protein